MALDSQLHQGPQQKSNKVSTKRNSGSPDIGKETLMHRAKNRKLELDDAVMMRLIKSWDTNSLLDFFSDMGEDKIDPRRFLDNYRDFITRDAEEEKVSAEEFHLRTGPEEEAGRRRTRDRREIAQRTQLQICQMLQSDLRRRRLRIHLERRRGEDYKEGCPNADHIRGTVSLPRDTRGLEQEVRTDPAGHPAGDRQRRHRHCGQLLLHNLE